MFSVVDYKWALGGQGGGLHGAPGVRHGGLKRGPMCSVWLITGGPQVIRVGDYRWGQVFNVVDYSRGPRCSE